MGVSLRLRFSALFLFVAILIASGGCDQAPWGSSGSKSPVQSLEEVKEANRSERLASTVEVAVRANDDKGNPVKGAEVQFETADSSGTVSKKTATTGSKGIARVSWTLADALGPQKLNAWVAGADSVTFRTEARSEAGLWIATHDKILSVVEWIEEGTGETVPFLQWSLEKRRDLRRFSRMAEKGDFPPVDKIPDNKAADALAPDGPATTLFSKEDAWEIYIAHLAHSIALEFNDTLPWSLLDYSEKELFVLLSSEVLYEWTSDFQGTGLSGYVVGTDQTALDDDLRYTQARRTTPTSPAYTYSFLTENNLLKDTQRETVAALIQWARVNLEHMAVGDISDSGTIEMSESHWQYPGAPPLPRIIEGTTRTRDGEFGHFTWGCHGTNFLFQEVLRGINVPVYYRRGTWRTDTGGHATPYFPNLDVGLSHGDDPYNQMTKTYLPETGGYPYAADSLLISRETYRDWYFHGARGSGKYNVSRQVAILALRHVPDRLLRYHCEDKSSDRSRSESDVFEYFSQWYSVEELESRNLWERIEEKISNVGGCDALRNSWDWDYEP